MRKDGPPQFFSDAERARWEAAGKPGFGPSAGIDTTDPAAGSLSFGWETLGVHARDEIPTDPGALAQLVASGARGTKNPLPYEEFQLIAEVLRFAPLSGAQTAAFYQVLAALPGIELVGPAKDSLGRAGTAFAVDRGGPTREELILDPRTGRLLGSRTTLTAPDPHTPGSRRHRPRLRDDRLDRRRGLDAGARLGAQLGADRLAQVLHDRLAERAHLLVGERPVLRLERQPQRQRAPARAERLGVAPDVEDLDVAEQLAARLARRREHGAGRVLVADHDGDVLAQGRELRERQRPGGSPRRSHRRSRSSSMHTTGSSKP